MLDHTFLGTPLPDSVTLDGELSAVDVAAIAVGARVQLDAEALAGVQRNREVLEEIL